VVTGQKHLGQHCLGPTQTLRCGSGSPPACATTCGGEGIPGSPPALPASHPWAGSGMRHAAQSSLGRVSRFLFRGKDADDTIGVLYAPIRNRRMNPPSDLRMFRHRADWRWRLASVFRSKHLKCLVVSHDVTSDGGGTFPRLKLCHPHPACDRYPGRRRRRTPRPRRRSYASTARSSCAGCVRRRLQTPHWNTSTMRWRWRCDPRGRPTPPSSTYRGCVARVPQATVGRHGIDT